MEQYGLRQMMEQDMGVDPETGLLRREEGCLTNYLPLPVSAGSRLRLRRDGGEYRCFFYSPEIPGELIYSYTYQPEANWTSFQPTLSDGGWRTGERVIDRRGFVRLTLRNGGASAPLDELFSLEAEEDAASAPSWLEEEAERTAGRVRELRREEDAAFLLLTDTHYAAGCNWPDTLASLRLMAEKLRPDGLIHLGDFTDGLLPERHTRGLAAEILDGLRGLCGTFCACLGNHDMNYFRGNPGQMTKEQCAALYLGRETPWYYLDLPEKSLRLLFLDSFSPTAKERYGFPLREALWLRRVLRATPAEYKLLVFSHVPPLPEIHVWSDTIRNGERMLRLLERRSRRYPGSVLGWIHGHNHADQILWRGSFPIVAVGCSKLEDFSEHKPEGSVTWPRRRDDPSQELWDVLLIRPERGELDFVRFGAGEDRHTSVGVRRGSDIV